MNFDAFVEGFFLQASLILALGAQNLFVLESGVYKRRHLLVAAICSACDVLLILTGVLGAATLFVQNPIVKILVGAVGVAFLGYYGLLKVTQRASCKLKGEVAGAPAVIPCGVIIGQALAVTILNPHVYLDTLVLVGGYSTELDTMRERFVFGIGASSFSALWFFGLSIFAATTSRYLKNAKLMRGISITSGAILIGLSAKLGLEVWEWWEALY